MQLQPGTYLQGDKYRIICTLGSGGFGITYLAEQTMTERKVCVKEFFPKSLLAREDDSRSVRALSNELANDSARFKAKFIKEAKTIASLKHPNIVQVFDAFEENGTAYYIMEYIEGESLSSIIKRGGALDEATVVHYIRQVADALNHIHERKIMHLDIKPGNVMLRSKDNSAMLIDFGLSKHYDAQSGEATSTTPVGVSHGFAPLEQYRQGGVKEFSPETDIYSLGATLYYLVTGTVPPDAADVADDGLPTLPAHLSESTRSAIEHAMADKRKERPHSIKEFMVLLGEDKRVVVPAPAPIVEETVVSMPQPAEAEKTVIVASAPAQPKETSPRVEQQKPKAPKTETPKKKSKWWLWLLLLVAVICSIVALSGESEEEKETTGPYKVGDYYNENGKEGVVFQVWADGHHGMIVSLDEARLQWCTVSQYDKQIVVGASSESDGRDNTDKVMNRMDSKEYPAFTWCRAKGPDWYLPAKNELMTIYNNKSEINSTLELYGDALTTGWYWSSTEYDEFCAWLVDMSDGGTVSYYKDDFDYVRAVSAF